VKLIRLDDEDAIAAITNLDEMEEESGGETPETASNTETPTNE
jgi:hypothetical protein